MNLLTGGMGLAFNDQNAKIFVDSDILTGRIPPEILTFCTRVSQPESSTMETVDTLYFGDGIAPW
jgi:hypothetical protein